MNPVTNDNGDKQMTNSPNGNGNGATLAVRTVSRAEMEVLSARGIALLPSGNIPQSIKAHYRDECLSTTGKKPTAKQMSEYFKQVQGEMRPFMDVQIAEAHRANWFQALEKTQTLKTGQRKLTYSLLEPKAEKPKATKESGFTKLVRFMFDQNSHFDVNGRRVIHKEFYQCCKGAGIKQEAITGYVEKFLESDKGDEAAVDEEVSKRKAREVESEAMSLEEAIESFKEEPVKDEEVFSDELLTEALANA